MPLQPSEQTLDHLVFSLPCAQDEHYPMSLRISRERSEIAVHGLVTKVADKPNSELTLDESDAEHLLSQGPPARQSCP